MILEVVRQEVGADPTVRPGWHALVLQQPSQEDREVPAVADLPILQRAPQGQG